MPMRTASVPISRRTTRFQPMAARVDKADLGDRRDQGRDETGTVLVLALVFLIVGALIVGSLSSLTINDLNNTSKFNNATSVLYAAGSATQVAMWSTRYTYPVSTGSPGYPCPGTNPSIQIDGQYIADWCVARLNFNPLFATREVVLSACATAGPTVLTANCSVPLLEALVDFNDNTAKYQVPSNCTSTNQSTCGGGTMTVVSWKARQTPGT